MDVLMYLLLIVGSPWLSDAMIDFSESQKGHLVPYVERPAETVETVGRQLCYCIGRICFYCPDNTYCAVDRSGCCPRPGCRNHCGRFCLCPGYPICCPYGTCPRDYPKCCGKLLCCKNDGNCCEGKHCCDAKSSCCGKGCCPKDNGKCCTSASTKEKLCCVKKDLGLEDDVNKEMKDEGDLHMNVKIDDEKIFKELCQTFKAQGQFAVLVVGRLSDHYGLQPKPKPPLYDNKEKLCTGDNYAAAVFQQGGKHTEDTILGYADDMINKYKGKYGRNPELFLYSKYNPCCGGPLSPNCENGCAGKIKAKLTELKGKITSMTIAWDYNYKMGAMPFDKAFLFSLNSMLSPENARLSWNAGGYCRKTPRKWFQKTMFDYLLQTAKDHPFCKKANVEKDLARLINKVTWICGTRSTAEDEPYQYPLDYDDDDRETLGNETGLLGIVGRPARDPDCWKKEVKSLDHYGCSQLPKTGYMCAELCISDDLGPALEPSNPTTCSSSATDVRGEYGKLCFESGSCTAMKNSQDESYKTRKDQIGDETGYDNE